MTEPFFGARRVRPSARRGVRSLTASAVAIATTIGMILGGVLPASAEPASFPRDVVPTETASVGGTVVDSGAAPLPGISVWVYLQVPAEDGGTKWDDVEVIRTDLSGTYRVDDLPAGVYTLAFFRDSNKSVLSEYWHDKPDLDTADTFTLSPGETKDAMDAALSASATISGTVVSEGGAAAADVSVRAYRLEMLHRGPTYFEQARAWTDASGSYVITGLKPGTYTVWFNGDWPDLRSEWWDDQLRLDDAAELPLVEGTRQAGIDAELAVVPQLSSSMPVINGIPYIGSTLTVDTGVWTEGTEFTYRWYADDTLIEGEDDPSLVVAEEHGDQRISVIVSGTKPDYRGIERRSDPTPPVFGGTLSSATPTIHGDTAVGAELTVEPGAWYPGAILTYQWMADGLPVYVATSETLLLGNDEAGKRISVTVTGTKAGYASVSEESAQTKIVTGGTLSADTPTISGTERVGTRLTAVPGSWTAGTSFTYQWHADAVAIPDATSATFYPTADLVGARISVTVGGAREGFLPRSKTSSQTARVVPGGLTTSPVSVTGVPAVGLPLTSRLVRPWTEGASLSYRWFADGAEIPGATGTSFTPGAAQAGKAITVEVTGTKAGYTSRFILSEPTAQVIPAATAAVVGLPRFDEVLTAETSGFTAGEVLRYEWFAGGAHISGATTRTLRLPAALVGTRISVAVSGTFGGYEEVTVLSGETAPVALRVLSATAPGISGKGAVGSVLAVKPGPWTAGATLSYRWYANGAAISGATKSTLKLGASHKGKRITVTVTGRKSGWTVAAKTSAATGKVATASTPRISGTPKVGSRLTVRIGTWTSGTKYAYQWYSGGTAIAGATKSTLTVKRAQKGKAITVTVTGKKSGYATVAKTSKATAKIR